MCTFIQSTILQLKFIQDKHCFFSINGSPLQSVIQYTWKAPLDTCGINMPDICGKDGASLNMSLIFPEKNWNNFWYMRFGDQICDISHVDGITWIGWRDRSYVMKRSSNFTITWNHASGIMTINGLNLPFVPADDIECRLGPGSTPGTYLVSINEIRHDKLIGHVTQKTIRSCEMEALRGPIKVEDEWELTNTESIFTTELNWINWPAVSDTKYELVQPGLDEIEGIVEVGDCNSSTKRCSSRLLCPRGNDTCIFELAQLPCG